MSRLLDFYRGEEPDIEGRMLQDIWNWSDDDLESVHDFIQWLFPLPEASQFNPDAPLLTPEEIAAFRGDELLRANLRQSFARILSFLGLTLSADERVSEGLNFLQRVPDIWGFPNHNWLRITRILRSLRLLGLDSESRALYQYLEALYSSRKFPITAQTFRYWEDAGKGAAP